MFYKCILELEVCRMKWAGLCWKGTKLSLPPFQWLLIFVYSVCYQFTSAQDFRRKHINITEKYLDIFVLYWSCQTIFFILSSPGWIALQSQKCLSLSCWYFLGCWEGHGLIQLIFIGVCVICMIYHWDHLSVIYLLKAPDITYICAIQNTELYRTTI